MHFKDIDPVVRERAIAARTGFYEACGQGIFCNLGKGMTLRVEESLGAQARFAGGAYLGRSRS